MAGLLSVCLVGAQSISERELTTTNRLQTPCFWQAVERSNGPVTVLAFGDSMAATWQSVQYELFTQLQSNLGSAGFTLQNYRNTALVQYGGGAAWANYNTNWWTEHAWLPPGGFVYWTNSSDARGSHWCDRVGLYWVAHSSGGVFTLSVSTNGQTWGEPLLTLDGFATNRVGRHTNLPLSRANYRLRVDGLSGTNSILGPEYRDTTSAGVNIAFMSQAGANLNQIFTLPTNVLHPILSAINPQLVVYHMKELADIGEANLSNRLFHLEAMWQACVTNGDVVYLGTPYDYRDATQEFTPRENRLLRQAAVRDGRAYLDCMNPCVSYQAMVTNSYITDTLHPNKKGNLFLTGVIWPQLGFFALRKDRHLDMRFDGELCRLEWASATNIAYELLSSTNLRVWDALIRVAGTGQRQAYTNAEETKTNRFYRLSLRPY